MRVCVLVLDNIDQAELHLCYQLTLYILIKVILDTVSSCWLMPNNPENIEIDMKLQMCYCPP